MFNNGFQHINSHYKNFRVFEWRAYLGLAVLGFISAINIAYFDYVMLFIFLITTSLYLAFSFSINNCFDIKSDIKEHKTSKNPVAAGLIKMREAIIVSVSTALVGIFIAYLWLNPVSFYIYILLIILSYLFL